MANPLIVLILVLFLTLSLHGQNSNFPNPESSSAGSATALAAGDDLNEEIPAQISKIKTFLAPFIYKREELRNPFQALGSAAPLNPGEVYGPFLEIQNYPLSSYKLKGLLWNIENPMALFEGPEGKQYRLGIKDYIGENFGYIATIREKEVVIIQTIEENQRRYSTTKVVFLNE